MDEESQGGKITPGLIWSRFGFYQQILFAFISAAVPSVIFFIYTRNPAANAALGNWLSRIGGMFQTERAGVFAAMGALAGFGLSWLFLGLEFFIAKVRGEPAGDRLNRNNDLLPQNSEQKKWALLINGFAAFLEEILFRAFFLAALIPLWDHWIWAALVVSAVFAFFHTNAQGFSATLWIFLASFVLCASVVLFKSLFFAWTLHLILNLTNLFLFPALNFGNES